MRKQMIEVETREEAEEACPWAAVIVEVCGGWMCFESVQDHKIWEAQK